MKLLLLAPVQRWEMSSRVTADRQLGPGQAQSAAFKGHDIRETSVILSDNPIGAWGSGNGNGWGGEKEKNGVRHQQRKTERHGGMQLPLQAWNPLIRQVCSSSPLVSTTSPRIPPGWLACGLNLHKKERNVWASAGWLMSLRRWCDWWFGGTLRYKTTLGAAKHISGEFIVF